MKKFISASSSGGGGGKRVGARNWKGAGEVSDYGRKKPTLDELRRCNCGKINWLADVGKCTAICWIAQMLSLATGGDINHCDWQLLTMIVAMGCWMLDGGRWMAGVWDVYYYHSYCPQPNSFKFHFNWPKKK